MSEADDEAPGEDGCLPETVEIPIGDSIDLHWFRPSETGDVVDAYLEAAAEAGYREVRIIHGRGRGVQRHRVQRRLARSPHVERFADAPWRPRRLGRHPGLAARSGDRKARPRLIRGTARRGEAGHGGGCRGRRTR